MVTACWGGFARRRSGCCFCCFKESTRKEIQSSLGPQSGSELLQCWAERCKCRKTGRGKSRNEMKRKLACNVSADARSTANRVRLAWVGSPVHDVKEVRQGSPLGSASKRMQPRAGIRVYCVGIDDSDFVDPLFYFAGYFMLFYS